MCWGGLSSVRARRWLWRRGGWGIWVLIYNSAWLRRVRCQRRKRRGREEEEDDDDDDEEEEEEELSIFSLRRRFADQEEEEECSLTHFL